MMNEQLEDAAKGVVPINTKSINEWALRNLNAWMENRNILIPDDPVPSNLLSCAQETKKKWSPLPCQVAASCYSTGA